MTVNSMVILVKTGMEQTPRTVVETQDDKENEGIQRVSVIEEEEGRHSLRPDYQAIDKQHDEHSGGSPALIQSGA